MIMKRECPTDRLPLLMQDDLSSEESSELLVHLETCDGCRRELDTLSADETWWSRASRGLSGVTLDQRGQVPIPEESACSYEALMDDLESDLDNQAEDWPPDQVPLDPPTHPEMLGRIDEFDIEEKIGQGGMGVVFRGFDRTLNRPVAIKVLAPHLGANAVARQRFSREAQAAAAVVHPHVVPIYRVNASARRPYIAMALVDGDSLQEQVSRNGPLQTKDVVRVSIQIADGLAAAHRLGLIHRDIKPANVLMEKDVSRVMISDFGLARAIDDVAMTQSGCLAGTPHYMSPEQVSGGELDHRTDLFSVGSLMYFIATGREPFQAEGAFAVISKIVCDVPPSPRSVNPDVPESLSRIIEGLLEKKPSNRIQSAAELQQLLTDYLAHLQDPQHHALPHIKPTYRERVRRWKRFGWALAVTGMIGLGCWGVISSGWISDKAWDFESDSHHAGGGDGHAGEEHDSHEHEHDRSHH
jgi:serine/threonine protein kinase